MCNFRVELAVIQWYRHCQDSIPHCWKAPPFNTYVQIDDDLFRFTAWTVAIFQKRLGD